MQYLRSSLFYGCACVLAMNLLFPPWVMTIRTAQLGGQVTRPIGYGFIFSPPELDEQHTGIAYGVALDFDRLGAQTLALLVVCGVLMFRRPKAAIETAVTASPARPEAGIRP